MQTVSSVRAIILGWWAAAVKYDVVIEASLEDEKVDKEVMDIDSRLHALQYFLKTAKASVK